MAVQAKGLMKVLGKSKLFKLDILLRELVQNSLDAWDGKSGRVTVELDFIRCKDHDEVVGKIGMLAQKKNDPLFKRMEERIRQGDPVLLVLSDKGTTGLTGPVRQDSRDQDTYKGRKNFENLVYHLGINHGEDLAGGSYGFGKTIFYHLGLAGLVMYYSRTDKNERLAFCMISEEENDATKNGTGIAWWGDTYRVKEEKRDAPVPIENSGEIVQILKKMGLLHKRLQKGETGTVICIIAPDLQNLLLPREKTEGDEDPEEVDDTDAAIKAIEGMVAASVQKWFWPRMTITRQVHEKGELCPLQFINCGQEIRLATEYAAMSKLLKAAENNNAGIDPENSCTVKPIWTERYGNVFLGTVAFQIIPPQADKALFNRIFMIRWPRMVVFDVPVRTRTDSSVAALFLVNSKQEVKPNGKPNAKLEKLDNAFKVCESATHSEWNFEDLDAEKKWFRTYVNTVREQAPKIIADALHSGGIISSDNQISPSAKILGKLLLSTDVGGIETTPPGTKSSGGGGAGIGGGNRKPRLQVKPPVYLQDGNIQFDLTAENISAGDYIISVLAGGERRSYDSSSWRKNLGYEFPFRILQCTGSISTTIVEDTDINFSTSSPPSESVSLQLTIQPVKKDALISFDISKINNQS